MKLIDEQLRSAGEETGERRGPSPSEAVSVSIRNQGSSLRRRAEPVAAPGQRLLGVEQFQRAASHSAGVPVCDRSMMFSFSSNLPLPGPPLALTPAA